MSKNPVEYAEKILKVHDPWNEAKILLKEHQEKSSLSLQYKATIRSLKDQIEDRKFEIASEAPSTPGYPTGVQAQRDFNKLLVSADSKVNLLEEELQVTLSHQEQIESRLKFIEIALHVLTARMTSLGGLLNFYAAVKNASIGPSS